MIRCGFHGDIRIRPTTSGRGRRVSSLDGEVTGVAYHNRDNLIMVWPNGQTDHDSPLSLGGAVKKLRGKVRAILTQRKKREREEALHERRGWLRCRSCHQLEPYKGYVDRRTRQCQLCDEMVIDIADECEIEMMARAHEMAAQADDAWPALRRMMNEAGTQPTI